MNVQLHSVTRRHMISSSTHTYFAHLHLHMMTNGPYAATAVRNHIKPLGKPASTAAYNHSDEFIQSHLELADAAAHSDMYQQPERSAMRKPQGRVLEKLTSAVRRMSRKSIDDLGDFTAPKAHIATKVSFRRIEHDAFPPSHSSCAGSTHSSMEVINLRRNISAPASTVDSATRTVAQRTRALTAASRSDAAHHADPTSRRRTITRLLSLTKSGSFEHGGVDCNLDCDAAKATGRHHHHMLERLESATAATVSVAKRLSAPLSGEHMVSSSDRAGMALMKQKKALSKRDSQDLQPAEPYRGPCDVQQSALELALVLGARSRSSSSYDSCKRPSLATSAATLRVTLARMDAILRSRRAASTQHGNLVCQ